MFTPENLGKCFGIDAVEQYLPCSNFRALSNPYVFEVLALAFSCENESSPLGAHEEWKENCRC